MDSAKSRRQPCFLDINDGLASLAEAETSWFSSNNHNSLISRRTSLNNLSFDSSISSPRRFSHTRIEQPHFLDSCFLCNKPLARNRDIFMYRGDIPFCSEECRQKQIDMDEAKDKKINLSASIKALREKDHRKEYPLRRDSVVAA